MRRARPFAGAAATALALLAPPAARAGPPGSEAVLALAASSRLADPDLAAARERTAALLAATAAAQAAAEQGDAADGAAARVPAWIERRVSGWSAHDGTGYRVLSPAGATGAWFLGGDLERPTGPEPLVIEPYEEPDSPRRRVAGEDARSLGAVLDLSELPHLLVALGAGGGRRHLHAYLGWQVTVAAERPGG